MLEVEVAILVKGWRHQLSDLWRLASRDRQYQQYPLISFPKDLKYHLKPRSHPQILRILTSKTKLHEITVITKTKTHTF